MKPSRIEIGLFALLLAALSAPALGEEPAAEPSNDELFQKAFKKKPVSKPVEIALPLFFENQEQPVGTVKTRVGTKPENLLIEASPLLNFLSRVVEPTFYKPMEIQGEGLTEHEYEEGWIPISAFKASGYQLVYDESRLELRLHVPPELRKTRTTSISRTGLAYEGDPPLTPSWLSAFLNANASVDYQNGFGDYVDGRQPLRARFDGAVNLASWVLESNADYTENMSGVQGVRSFTRGDTRLVKDYPFLFIRQTVGDLNHPVRGFQTFVPMGGISISTNFGLQPSRLTLPTGQREVFLKRPSTVKIFVNGQQRGALDLPAGRHDLRDFPFTGGLNEITIEITDDMGQVETQTLSFFSTQDLLKPGLNQLSYAVGAPSDIFDGKRTYDASHPVFSAFHRIGMTNFLTLGANLQTDRDSYVAGAEALIGTKLGFISLEPATSKNALAVKGHAGRLRYLYVDYDGPAGTQRTFTLGVESRLQGFSAFTDTLGTDTRAHDVMATYGQALSQGVNFNLNAAYQISRDPNAAANAYRFGISFNKSWSPGLNTSATLQQARNPRGMNDTSVAVFLTWRFLKERQYITAAYSPDDDSARLAWNMAPQNNYNGTRAQIGVDKIGADRGLTGRLQNINGRSILGLNHRTDWIGTNPQARQVTSAQVGTSLMFADWRFAIGRPVLDSFLIVAPQKSASGQYIEVNPMRNGSAMASTGFIGPAVLSELPSYNYFPITLGTARLKPGTVIDQDHFTVYPSYKSGFAVGVGSEPAISITATLIKPDGKPLAMQAATAQSLSDSSAEPITLFSDRRGQTRVQLKQGRYEIKFLDETWESFQIEVTESSEGEYNMGQIQLKPRNQ